MDEAEVLCDRVVVVQRGQVVAAGTPDDVRAGHRTLEQAYLELTAPELAGRS